MVWYVHCTVYTQRNPYIKYVCILFSFFLSHVVLVRLQSWKPIRVNVSLYINKNGYSCGGWNGTIYKRICFGDELSDITKMFFVCGILLNGLIIPFQISHRKWERKRIVVLVECGEKVRFLSLFIMYQNWVEYASCVCVNLLGSVYVSIVSMKNTVLTVVCVCVLYMCAYRTCSISLSVTTAYFILFDLPFIFHFMMCWLHIHILGIRTLTKPKAKRSNARNRTTEIERERGKKLCRAIIWRRTCVAYLKSISRGTGSANIVRVCVYVHTLRAF